MLSAACPLAPVIDGCCPLPPPLPATLPALDLAPAWSPRLLDEGALRVVRVDGRWLLEPNHERTPVACGEEARRG